MRIQLASDLHLEETLSFGEVPHWGLDVSLSQQEEGVQRTDADVVILAGDINRGLKGIRWAKDKFAGQAVFYIPGNHESYGSAGNDSRACVQDEFEQMVEECRGSNVWVLQNTSLTYMGWTFVGGTLWSDFALGGDVQGGIQAAARMLDYSEIKGRNGLFTPAESLALHQESIGFLKKRLGECDPRRTIVATHHAPSVRSIRPGYENDPLAASYASALDEFVAQSGVALWAHGHTHHKCDYRIGNTRVISNPRGTWRDRVRDFDPAMVIEL